MRRWPHLVELPPPTAGERRHTFGGDEGEELRLIEPSPGCPCGECAELRERAAAERTGA